MILDRFRLEGKNALVVGAARGIGKAYAQALAEAGANVVIGDILKNEAQKTADELAKTTGRKVISIYVDVRDTSSVKKMFDEYLQEMGELNIAVNNAGIATNAPAEELTEEMWDELMAINLRGIFLCCREEGQIMIKQGKGGAIINTASMSARIVNYPQKQAHYNASKAGVVMLTKALAVEWAEYNIRVNAISPGYTLTEMNLRPEVEKLHPHWIERTPMKRLADPEDMMGAVVFLASETASFITGHELVIDGGFTLW
ncbi:SDR family oxidoreductase [Candidatus Sumerlaeota bacterium]|nr:SDR family oxidoreductase [Candidatus Sumerlaeota bacterium]